MDFKPGDLFFTVVEFFSVIVPGALTLALIWNTAALKPYFPILQSGFAEAAAFLLLSYLLGQLLHALASRLDTLYDNSSIPIIPRKKRARNKELADAVRVLIGADLHLAVPKEESILVWADAVLRTAGLDLSSSEHLEAESKFFRSLVVVLPLYLLFFMVNRQILPALAVLVLVPLAFWRFADRRIIRSMETYRILLAAHAMGKIAACAQPMSALSWLKDRIGLVSKKP